METTIDYGRDRENPSATIFHGMNDYGAEANDYKFCPIIISGYISASIKPNEGPELTGAIKCRGPRFSWFDADKSRCAVLSIARNR